MNCWVSGGYRKSRLNKEPDLYIFGSKDVKHVHRKHLFHTIVLCRNTFTNTPADETWYFGNLTLKSPRVEEMKATSFHT